jgi:hypothetical protein
MDLSSGSVIADRLLLPADEPVAVCSVVSVTKILPHPADLVSLRELVALIGATSTDDTPTTVGKFSKHRVSVRVSDSQGVTAGPITPHPTVAGRAFSGMNPYTGNTHTGNTWSH